MSIRVVQNKLRRIGILHMRGGLGNQLFQLSALAFYSKYLNFRPLIYDFDLTLSERDDYYPKYRHFDFNQLFGHSRQPIVFTEFQSLLMRQILKLPVQKVVLNGQIMDNLITKRETPPYFFIIRGSFEEDRFPLELGNLSIFNTISSYKTPSLARSANVAIHIRVSGYGELSSMEVNNLYKISERLAELGHNEVDIYSDDIPALLGKVRIKEGLVANWPENQIKMDSPQLLTALAKYSILVSNGSSISRWANYFACTHHNQHLIKIGNGNMSDNLDWL